MDHRGHRRFLQACGQGEGRADACPAPRLGLHLQAAPEDLDALPHPQKAEAPRLGGLLMGGSHVEPHPVVADDQLQDALTPAQLDPGVPRLGVPQNVGQGLRRPEKPSASDPRPGREATDRPFVARNSHTSHESSFVAGCGVSPKRPKPLARSGMGDTGLIGRRRSGFVTARLLASQGVCQGAVRRIKKWRRIRPAALLFSDASIPALTCGGGGGIA
jgi:hypothetical protein